MKYKTKAFIYEYETGYLFLNASEYADYRGVTRQAVSCSLKHGYLCKGHKIELTRDLKGPFYYSDNYDKEFYK